MKLSFVYGAKFLGGRPFNYDGLWDDPRGLTGSELSWFMFANEMRERGHEVHLFAPGPVIEDSPIPVNVPHHPDAVLAWNDPDLLRAVPDSVLRVVNQQLNDWAYCQPGFNAYVDVITSPHQVHRNFLAPITEVPESKWEILPNGCDPSLYATDGRMRVPGRVVYASCPSRGLHHLLAAWPRIRAAVPHAHLRVFYNVRGWVDGVLANPPDPEQVRRAHLLNELMGQDGVELVGSSSRVRMAREFSEAEVLAFPCDPVRFTEGFSVTTMEACAAACVPVIRPVDVLGSLYEGMPMALDLGEWEGLVVQALTDPAFRDQARMRGRKLAMQHAWPLLAGRLEEILERRLRAR